MPANQEPIITLDAPAASASATSRGWRTPPSAQTCLPSAAGLGGAFRTAENCGRPTPVIIRVVHIAPGPTPTLTMSAPASTRSRTPSAETTLPATTGHVRVEGCGRRRSASIIFVLVAVRGVDDEHVGAGREQRLGLAGDVAVDADRGARLRRRPPASTAGV